MITTLTKIFYFEFIVLLRQSKECLYPLIFFIIAVSFFPLAFTPETTLMRTYFSGFLWIAAIFANLLCMQTFFISDAEDRHIEQLFFCELPFPLLLLIKISAHWLMTQLPLILLAPLFALLFHLPFIIGLYAAASLLLGTPILLMVTCLGVALTIGLRQQGVLLALLIMPLTVPILIFGVTIIQQAQAGLSARSPSFFLGGLCLLSLITFPFIISAVLKIGLED